jgi:UDP-N-acetylmuramate dehydrogenase
MTLHFYELLTHNAELPTWFGVGGRADTLAKPHTNEQLRDLLLAFADQPVRILGDGANLLVGDSGVDGLVISLTHLNHYEAVINTETDPDGDVIVHAKAGALLPKIITDTVREGLAGLEGLAGIPASVGGAILMNAGGAFGETESAVQTVYAMSRFGEPVIMQRDEINFDYRHSGLGHLIITAVDFRLRKVPAGAEPALRDRLKEVMAYKKTSQPLAQDSAGCCFKNPTVRGEKVSAGKLIDEAGCKGLRIGGAEVSDKHANFVVAHDGCTASDIISLMERVEARVLEHAGMQLHREIIVWQRSTADELRPAAAASGSQQ